MSDPLLLELEKILIGRSPAMHRLRAEVVRYGALGLPVLVEGPTGSGKELVARGLHVASRRTGPMVAFNVCAVPDTMFEDALFGHVKGAFTGAMSDSPGYLAEANGGSVVLDEINGLSQVAQAKLLRAIETGVFRPVGARIDRRSDFRLISTSNAKLMQSAHSGTFRSDLYFRLSGLTVTVPALRERVVDLPELIQHFLRELREFDRVVEPEGLVVLQGHTWPGNVRELRHVIARAVSIADRQAISASVVQAAIGMSDPGRMMKPVGERAELAALLNRYGWDTGRVAQDLGVHRATVYRRMQRFGLTGSTSSDEPSARNEVA